MSHHTDRYCSFQVFFKLFEKLLLKQLKPIVEEKHIMSEHQFGFCNKHYIVDQIHCVTNVINKDIAEKNIVFLRSVLQRSPGFQQRLAHRITY
jgi:hypothetical protein